MRRASSGLRLCARALPLGPLGLPDSCSRPLVAFLLAAASGSPDQAIQARMVAQSATQASQEQRTPTSWSLWALAAVGGLALSVAGSLPLPAHARDPPASKASTSKPAPASPAAKAPDAKPAAAAPQEKDEAGRPVYSREEVSKHRTLQDGIWVTYKDGVYDITEVRRDRCYTRCS
jgi:hypothetical protein